MQYHNDSALLNLKGLEQGSYKYQSTNADSAVKTNCSDEAFLRASNHKRRKATKSFDVKNGKYYETRDANDRDTTGCKK